LVKEHIRIPANAKGCVTLFRDAAGVILLTVAKLQSGITGAGMRLPEVKALRASHGRIFAATPLLPQIARHSSQDAVVGWGIRQPPPPSVRMARLSFLALVLGAESLF
jgi:hypothetical protein